MTGLSDHEAFLDELDKKLVISNEGILSLFGPEEYFVSFDKLKTENEVIEETLKFSMYQIDYLSGDNLPQRFMRFAYNKLKMWDKVNDIYREYGVHAFRGINWPTNKIEFLENGKSLSIFSEREKPSLKISKLIDSNYTFEILKSGYIKNVIGKATVNDFKLYCSENYLVVILPSQTSWRYVENELEPHEKLEYFYRISIPCKYLGIDMSKFFEYIQCLKNS